MEELSGPQRIVDILECQVLSKRVLEELLVSAWGAGSVWEIFCLYYNHIISSLEDRWWRGLCVAQAGLGWQMEGRIN